MTTDVAVSGFTSRRVVSGPRAILPPARLRPRRRWVGALVASALCLPGLLAAQALNWEGPSGGVVTPFATIAHDGGLIHPSVAFHVLQGGDLVGRRFQGSITLGLGSRLELGYTRSSVTSPESFQRMLFDRGFNTFHGKFNLLTEDRWPAVSVGALWRWQRRHLEGGLGVATKNTDVYLAVTRTIPLTPGIGILLNGGARFSNAALMGIAGNSPDGEVLGFAAGGMAVGTLLTVGAEYLQEPEEIDGMPGAELPATLSAFARLYPIGTRLSFDLAVLRLAGVIAPGFDADAEHQLLLAASYSF